MKYVPERTNEIEENKACQASGSNFEREMERPTEKDKIRVAGKENVRISLARPTRQTTLRAIALSPPHFPIYLSGHPT